MPGASSVAAPAATPASAARRVGDAGIAAWLCSRRDLVEMTGSRMDQGDRVEVMDAVAGLKQRAGGAA